MPSFQDIEVHKNTFRIDTLTLLFWRKSLTGSMSKFIIPIRKHYEMKPFEISIRLKKIIRAIIAKGFASSS